MVIVDFSTDYFRGVGGGGGGKGRGEGEGGKLGKTSSCVSVKAYKIINL